MLRFGRFQSFLHRHGPKFTLLHPKPIDETTYNKVVVSLIYLIATRPNFSFAVSYSSRFMIAPKDDHWVATKRVLHYVKGTFDYRLLYARSHDSRLSGFIDLDWIGSVNDKMLAFGYVFNVGSDTVTWTSKK